LSSSVIFYSPATTGIYTLSLHDALPIFPEEEDKWGGSEKREEKKLLFRVNTFASEFYHQRLLKTDRNHEAWKYLAQRRLTEEDRSEEHTSELQSRENLVCRLLLEKNNDL